MIALNSDVIARKKERTEGREGKQQSEQGRRGIVRKRGKREPKGGCQGAKKGLTRGEKRRGAHTKPPFERKKVGE